MEGLKAKLAEIFARPNLTSRDAEEAAEAAEAIADLIRARDRALQVLQGSANQPEPPPRRRETLEGLPLKEAARNILRREGYPMHARKLGELIYEAGWKNPRGGRAGERIVFQLAARLGEDPDFVRWAPTVWALREQGFVEPPANPPKPTFPLFHSPPGSPPAAELDDELATAMEQDLFSWRS